MERSTLCITNKQSGRMCMRCWRIYRITHPVKLRHKRGFVQPISIGDKPLLFHRLRDVSACSWTWQPSCGENLRYIAFSHVEADWMGSLRMVAGPAVCPVSAIGCHSIDRRPCRPRAKAMADKSLSLVSTPCMFATPICRTLESVLWRRKRSVLLCGDLFTQAALTFPVTEWTFLTSEFFVKGWITSPH